MLRSDYRRTLDELSKVVSRDRILVLFYERLFRDESIASLCDFLEIDSVEARLSERINATPNKLPMDVEIRKLYVNILAPVYMYVLRKFDDLPESWLRDVDLIEGDFNSFYEHYDIDLSGGSVCDSNEFSDFHLGNGFLFHLVFGSLCLEKGDIALAESLLQKAVEFNADSAQARFLLSRVYEDIKEFDKAIKYAKDTILMAPTNALFRQQLGKLLKITGEEECAIVSTKTNAFTE